MSQLKRASYAYFEDLRRRAREGINQGHWETALRLCEQAVAWAREHGDRDDLDLAYCNQGSILVAQGQGGRMVEKMRKILLSSSRPEICYQAAFNVSRHHEDRKEIERGLFYAKVCLQHAARTGDPEPVARAHNQIGHLQMRDSYFEQARDSYRKALANTLRSACPSSTDETCVRANLGYCRILLGDLEDGFSELFRSLRIARRLHGELWELWPRLGLGYAYLEIDRPRRAREHTRKALILAETSQFQWHVKNALYLLGDSEKLCGDEMAAHRCFSRLQRDFFPDDPIIPELLMNTDIRPLLNLMA